MSNDFASESGHWYKRNGEPAYTTLSAKGTPRPTTLRDAKKFDLVPSVTTVIRQASAPGLERWKLEQAIRATLIQPFVAGESERDWLNRVSATSREQTSADADRGTMIHTAIEEAIRGQKVPPGFDPYASTVLDLLHKHYPDVTWESERSFASPLGYGGKVDLHSKLGIVVDFKSKDGDLSTVKCYDEHFMQNAAYANGLGMPEATCVNIFVSRQILPGEERPRVIMIHHDQTDISRGWRMFRSLLSYFQAKTGLGE